MKCKDWYQFAVVGVACAIVLAAAPPSGPPKLDGVQSIVFRVANLDAARRHYEGHLGLRYEQTSADAAVVTINDGQSIRLQSGLPAGENVRLVEVAFGAPDVKAVHAAMRRAKVAASKLDAQTGFTVRDPDGTVIRFVPSIKNDTAVSRAAISTHLEHIGVLVNRANVDAARRFYKELLGLRDYWEYAPNGKLRLIKYIFNGTRPDIVELMIHDGNLTRGQIGSMNHINLAVSDIHHTHRTLVARGAKAPTPIVNAEDLWAMNLFDPDGTRTEIQVIRKMPAAAILDDKFHARDAWVLSNGLMRVSIVKGGGFIGEVRLTSGDERRDINPMRVPHYQTIDPHTYQDAVHNATFGDDPHRWLHSGYLGHYVCFPWYGPPSSAAEIKAGLGNHGEAAVVPWRETGREVNDKAAVLKIEADLPKSHFRIGRTITLPRGLQQVTVDEWVENLLDTDRTVNWMQHATFGPPFVEPGKSVMRISAAKASPDSEPLHVRTMPGTPKSGGYTALLMDLSRPYQFFTMRNTDMPLTVGYVYPTEGNAWVGDWQENKKNEGKPWNGVTVARGIEFGSTPYAESLKKSVDRGRMFDVPAFRWIGGRERQTNQYTIFLTDGDPKDVTMADGVVVLAR